MGSVDALLASFAELELWQVGLAVLIVVAGSSATSAWITSAFEASTASKAFRRSVRARALKSIGRSYALYIRYGSVAKPSVVDPERDEALAEAGATMHAAVAGLGKNAPLMDSKIFSLTGELFAAQNEDTSVSELDGIFTNLIEKISNGIPEK